MTRHECHNIPLEDVEDRCTITGCGELICIDNRKLSQEIKVGDEFTVGDQRYRLRSVEKTYRNGEPSPHIGLMATHMR